MNLSQTTGKTCCRCSITRPDYYFSFHDSRGWYCQNCAPSYRDCRNEMYGCPYRDLPWKCWKHLNYFCVFAPKCGMCQRNITQHSMLSHFLFEHDTGYKTGNEWRVISQHRPEFIVWSNYGPLILSCYIDNKALIMNMLGTIHSAYLHEFRCSVKITDPKSGQTYICNLEESYVGVYDWKLKVDTNHFSDWSGVLDVSIDFDMRL